MHTLDALAGKADRARLVAAVHDDQVRAFLRPASPPLEQVFNFINHSDELAIAHRTPAHSIDRQEVARRGQVAST